MKKNVFNKLILVVIVTLSVLSTILYINPTDIVTDSGFDTSYDSGSSSSSSSGGSSSTEERTPEQKEIDKVAIPISAFIFAILAFIYVKKESKAYKQ